MILERGEGRQRNIDVREKQQSVASHMHPKVGLNLQLVKTFLIVTTGAPTFISWVNTRDATKLDRHASNKQNKTKQNKELPGSKCQ